ncbi:tRNA (adenosine(37)-N6)-dimethylallyltransferase MiaA [Psychroflexus sp. S27]|uniref:tRNA (adenosine(37)-N6)-dimethylallyltransferase MiaA n=1 Tax=Psychroflexus sp. S27 TaxID=1982757 RepID=UPI000C297581|nr:tRNA (adenosine(37)-N6)-dimethylallyltransferase MiaA [Psychroflexus sp. S27]PJX20807.1 tRNA (adenosine(37)-N6)-dimethylallyltransferase MiaA [Psychroflexus sp. S27]
MKNNYLISIIGPTAIGKTALAIQLARYFDTEILSSDSRQFYKEMQIGTAVPSQEELSTAKHHFIQHKSIHDTYTVGDFEKEALATLEKLFKEKSVAIMVGGSGLYEKAVTKGLDKFPEVDQNILDTLNEANRKNGIEKLANKLIELDPDYAKNVDLENHQRVIRALSICLSSGKRFSGFLGQTENKRHFRNIIVGLDADRRIIYDRINQRVDIMLKNGLLEEAKSLEKYKTLNTLNTVGYKELFEFMDGNVSLEKAIENIKTNTRRFAKRQLTWYRKDDRVNWFNYQKTPEEIIKKLKDKYLLQS